MQLWTYRDADGNDVVVSNFADIPQQYRSKAKTIDQLAQQQTQAMKPSLAVPAQFHLPSFLSGAGAAMVVALFMFFMLRRRSKLMGMLLGMLAVAAIGAGYLTYMRSQVGLGAGLSSPADIVNDAKAATEALQQKLKTQDAELREVTK